jgi:hypothetical protein
MNQPPFPVEEFQTETYGFSLAQRGAAWQLWFFAWHSHDLTIPDDPKQLGLWFGLAAADVTARRDELLIGWHPCLEAGRLVNERLKRAWLKAEKERQQEAQQRARHAECERKARQRRKPQEPQHTAGTAVHQAPNPAPAQAGQPQTAVSARDGPVPISACMARAEHVLSTCQACAATTVRTVVNNGIVNKKPLVRTANGGNGPERLDADAMQLWEILQLKLGWTPADAEAAARLCAGKLAGLGDLERKVAAAVYMRRTGGRDRPAAYLSCCKQEPADCDLEAAKQMVSASPRLCV